MCSKLISRLEARGVLVSDGAMGTELAKMGLEGGACTESWNATHPEEVARVSSLYVEAGSELVLTNTFGASRPKLAQFGLDDRVAELVAAGIRLARRAVGQRALVAQSIGPTGKLLLPYGDAEPEELAEAFAEQVRAGRSESPDAVCVETMFSVREACLAVEASSGCVPCIIATTTFQKGPAGYRTLMGESPGDAVEALVRAGADVVGTNCGLPMNDVIEIVREMRAVTELPILVHVNAGLPKQVDGVTRFPDSPEKMASEVGELHEAGADIIGGCCGTTPEHIRAMAEALAPFRKS